MSMTVETTESNYFRVKNNNEVRKVLEDLGFTVFEEENKKMYFVSDGDGVWFDENAEVVLSIKPIDNTNFLGTLSDYTETSVEDILEEHDLSEEDIMITPIIEYIQDQLLDEKQCITVTGAGFDSNSRCNFNPFGYSMIITKNKVEGLNLRQYLENKAQELGVVL